MSSSTSLKKKLLFVNKKIKRTPRGPLALSVGNAKLSRPDTPATLSIALKTNYCYYF